MSDVEFDNSINFDREAEILKVLGHSVRLKIVAGLMSQSCNVKKSGSVWSCRRRLSLNTLPCSKTKGSLKVNVTELKSFTG